ncbi:MAG: hypothetical protein K2I80_08860 [Ruminococcus sp.]|nr:hypothetical protein [Ruminococcus sp.]MDE6848932.1 hypothetical protein [Ruminococcus sp.]
MLFLQYISLTYCKNVRYANYVNVRNSVKFAPVYVDKVSDCEVLFNRIMLFQDTDGLHERLNKIRQHNNDILYNPRCYTSPFGNRIAVKRSDYGNYEIMYRSGKSRGYYKSPFTLKNNEYGRIIYNDRYVEFDSRQWYYELHTINFINCDKSKYKEKIFFRKVPDYEYKDMQYLRYC